MVETPKAQARLEKMFLPFPVRPVTVRFRAFRLFWPTQPVLRETLCGIRRSHKRPLRPAAALTSPHIRLLLATGATDLAGLPDRALVLIDFGGAFRRAELVEIEWMLLKVSVGAMG